MPSPLVVAEPDTPFTRDSAEGAPAAPRASSKPSPLDPLFRQHARWLTGLLRLRFGREVAEDLLQETFLRAAASGTADSVRHPKAWLLAIALNAARDQARRRAVRPPTRADGAEEIADTPAPAAACQDEALLLKQVVLALPPKLRDVFLLSRFGGLTNEEIARRLGISIKTVEWRMTKALAICAARLHD